jgi:glutathione S-transferase
MTGIQLHQGISIMTNSVVRLYRHPLSGHSHRVELALSLLGVPFERVDVDLMKGEHKKPGFLELNAFGQVPVLVDGEHVIADSNAILVYLATTRDPARTWLPTAPEAQARVQRWLSVAAGPIAFGPAAARLVTVFGAKYDANDVIARARALLEVMNLELSRQSFLAGQAPTIADLAGYTYVAHAPEGNVSLGSYPNVRTWLARIESLSGFVPMKKTAVGLAA